MSTSEPFIIGLYPFAGELENGELLETHSEIWQWLINLVKYYGKPSTLPVLCTNSFYLDNTACQLLLDENILFHCSVKKNWFLPVTKQLELQVDDMGKWAAAENLNTGELAVFTWSGNKDIGKKYLLTNLLKKVPGKQESNNLPGWDAYKHMFNGCDRFNLQISDFMWPYWLSHWTSHFDDIFQVHVALNTVAIWREMHPNSNCGTTKLLLTTLATELHNRCVNNDLPPSQW